MILPAIGQLLPAAVAIALSPFPVIAVVLVLSSPDSKKNGVAFAAGWLVGLSVLTAIALSLVGGVDGEPGTSSGTAVAWLRVFSGGALIVLGVRKVRHRSTDAQPEPTPKWMDGIASMNASRSLRLGVILGGVNPKNIALAFAASTSVAEVTVTTGDSIVAGLIFVLLASAIVLGAVIVRLTMGDRAVRLLDGVRTFMLDNSAVITMVVFVALGAMVLGDGVTALTK